MANSIISKFIQSRKFEYLLLAIVLTVSGLAHGINMFNYPYYENDEGVYMSQAWALVTQGKLAPYTYWYDHAPFGWMQIAAWSMLTGGFSAFGFAINSGRALMLVFHIASSILLYAITKKYTDSRLISLTSVLIFALTPLGIYFQRRVLLDNMMIFWVLLSIFFLQHYNKKLSMILLSAVSLGLAILTKETAVVFIPILLYFVYQIANVKHKSFALIQWALTIVLIISIYFAYALIKGEFFPQGSVFSNGTEHVSLLDAVLFQSKREGGSILNAQESEFFKAFHKIWATEDPLLIWGGIIATLCTTAIAITQPQARVIAGLSLIFWAFLARGGFIIEFYILPLVPILALNISYALWSIYHGVKTILRDTKVAYLAALVPLIFLYFWVAQFIERAPQVRGGLNLYTAQQTKAQLDAVDWIIHNLEPDEFIVIDNYAYIDLRTNGIKHFPDADWYSKVDTDRDISEKKLQGDYTNIDYVAATPQIETDAKAKGLFLVDQALTNSRSIIKFDHDYWHVDIRGVITPQRIARAVYRNNTKQYLKDGQIIYSKEGGGVTLQNQADMLLRAVIQNDETSFNTVASWTKKHMRKQTGLYAYSYSQNAVLDQTGDTQANTQLATALILASNQWNKDEYKNDAIGIIEALKKENIIMIKNNKIAIKNNDKKIGDVKEYTVELKNIMPASYELFSQIDDAEYWTRTKTTAYQLLESCTKAATLPPDTCTYELQRTIATKVENKYSEKSYIVPIHIALDAQLFKSEQGARYLSSLTNYLKEWNTRYQLGAEYTIDGTVTTDYETVRSYAPAIATLSIINRDKAKEMWDLKVRDRLVENGKVTYWEDDKNIENQTYGWYATVFEGQLFPQIANHK